MSGNSSWSQLEQVLFQTAGLILKPAVPDQVAVCIKCRGARNYGYQTCYNCDPSSGCDLAGFCTYAVQSSQMMRFMYDYKRQPSSRASDAAINTITGLMVSKISRHLGCCEKIANQKLRYWTNMPSTKNEANKHSQNHPLYKMVHPIINQLYPHLAYLPIFARESALKDSRRYSPELYETLNRPSGHVLLVEDTWVSGNHVESVAQMLKDSGASAVSTLCIARAVNHGYGTANELIKHIEEESQVFAPDICPWTNSGVCP